MKLQGQGVQNVQHTDIQTDTQDSAGGTNQIANVSAVKATNKKILYILISVGKLHNLSYNLSLHTVHFLARFALGPPVLIHTF